MISLTRTKYGPTSFTREKTGFLISYAMEDIIFIHVVDVFGSVTSSHVSNLFHYLKLARLKT